MSEEPLPSEAPNEQPSPKPTAQPAAQPADQPADQPTKQANKSAELKTDQADSKQAEASEGNSEQRPPIKRNVRGSTAR